MIINVSLDQVKVVKLRAATKGGKIAEKEVEITVREGSSDEACIVSITPQE